MHFFVSLSVVAAALVATSANAQQRPVEKGQLDASPAMFTVLAAVNAAGYDAESDSSYNHPLRRAIREEIARRNPPVLREIRAFLRQHRQEDANAELRQYISYSLLVEDPPSFEFKMMEYQLPPDMAALKDFAPLLKRFYTEAGIEELWQAAQPAYEQVITRYHEPATRAILESSAYLRAPLGVGYMGRRFQIYIDLLGAPNQIHLRTYLDDYYLVLTHSFESQFEEIRRAYLHYLLDPLATKFAAKLEEKRPLLDYALGAPYLAEHYKQDFLLLATRSLIGAIEARLAPSAERQSLVDQAMREGFTLTAHFAEQLPAYEKQEQAMRLYFPELAGSMDFAREERRMQNFEFSRERPVRKLKPPPQPPAPELSAADKALEAAEEWYKARELDKARESYARVLTETSEKSLHAKAYYGLARIAALRNDPELAVKLFEKAVELGPPAHEKSWSLVYLGRLAEAAGDREAAANWYRAALNVDGGSPGARQAAEKGLQQAAVGKEK